MLRAIRAYQGAYQPKVSALELNLIESRVSLVLHDLAGHGADSLTRSLNVPVSETEEALRNLQTRGYVKAHGEGYALTDQGREKAEATWDLSHAHAEEALAGASKEQLDFFSTVLRGLINQ